MMFREYPDKFNAALDAFFAKLDRFQCPSPSHSASGIPMRLCLRLLPLLSASALAAQQSSTAGAPDTSAFRRLELPTPNSIRTGSGTPGPDYWQQRADYVIRATLDTSARSLRGEERITYTNNSPDTLRYLWLQLDQNVFNSQSRGSRIFDPRSRFGTGGAEGGVRILKVGAAGGRRRAGTGGEPRGAARLPGQRHGHEGGPRPPAAAQGEAGARDLLVVPLRPQPQPDGHRGDRRRRDLRGRAVVPAARGLRRRPGLEHRAVLRAGRVLPGVRELRREHHRAGRHDRGGDGRAPESGRGADRDPALAPGAGADQREHGRDPRPRRGGRSRLTPGRGVRHPHLAVHRRQRPRFRLGGVAHLHLGRGRGERRQDARDELLPALHRGALEGGDAVRQGRDRELLHPVGALSLPHREQRARDRGRDGVPDDRLLQPAHARDALQRHRPRVRPHLVPHGGGLQRAAVSRGWTRGSTSSSTTTTG